MKQKVLALALTTAALCAGTAIAADAGRRSGFDTLDRNADNLLTPGEAAQDPSLASSWPSVDGNGDGVVDRAEFSAFDAARPADPRTAESGVRTYPYGRDSAGGRAPTDRTGADAAAPERPAIVIEGRLSDTPTTEGDPAGYLPNAPGASESAVRALENGSTSGYVGTDERRARFDTLDSNRDGQLSHAEAPALSGVWRMIDADANDRLDYVEFSAFERSYGEVGAVPPADRSPDDTAGGGDNRR